MNEAKSSGFREGDLPRVSLVTPCYNAAPYLRAAIDSVLGQDYPDIDYLVMDGGSTDGTVELLEEYGGKIRWISEKDNGQADAIARGFEQTSGAILGWLNADDVLKPGAARAAVDAFRSHPGAALVYGNADFIDAAGRTLGPCTVVEPYCLHRLIHYGDYIIQPAAFFSRRAYLAVGGLDRSLNWAMDWDLWIRLARKYDVVFIDRDLASYRWLGSNKTAEGGLDRLREVEEVAGRYGCAGLPAYFRLEKARLLASRASQDMKQLRLGNMLKNLAGTAEAIFTSWSATKSLLDPHIWRNYRTAHALYRHVGENRSDRP
jgi:glycosyltransferase involved in cell wall biosynthesis